MLFVACNPSYMVLDNSPWPYVFYDASEFLNLSFDWSFPQFVGTRKTFFKVTISLISISISIILKSIAKNNDDVKEIKEN